MDGFPDGDTPIVITTRDGTGIRCQRVAFALSPGSAAMSERRWVFSTHDGRQHVGPLASTAQAREELELVVNEWWTARKAFLASTDISGPPNE